MTSNTESFHRTRAVFVDEMVGLLGAFGLEPADLKYEARVSPQGVTITASWSDLLRQEADVPMSNVRTEFATRIRDAFESGVNEAYARHHADQLDVDS